MEQYLMNYFWRIFSMQWRTDMERGGVLVGLGLEKA